LIIKEIDCENKKELKEFIRFPHSLYKNCEQYVPSLDEDEMNMFLKSKNGALEWCDVRAWVAYKDDVMVGRVASIYNRKYIEKMNQRQLRVTRFDFIDDKEVSVALIEKVKEWGRELECYEIMGPIGFSDLDKEGMMIQGFDCQNLHFTLYNFPYYLEHMENIGFIKLNDWIEYRISIPEQPDPHISSLAEKSKQKFGYVVKKFKNKKSIMPYLRKVLCIMNKVYAHLLGYTELSERQMDEVAQNFGLILNHRFLFIIENKIGDLVGYGFFAPNINRGMRKCMGRITVPGIIRLFKDLLVIKEKKRNDTVDFYSIGVLPEYQSLGVNAIIVDEGIKACNKYGIKYAETGPQLEYNNPIHSQWKTFNKEQHIQRRCWRLAFK
ncbi:MAG: N-acetyltransferase, partial [Bacilli bacterium]|nr:N-acetyltransferase [Bacilli bacterium]